jgi:hypothetical protein
VRPGSIGRKLNSLWINFGEDGCVNVPELIERKNWIKKREKFG